MQMPCALVLAWTRFDSQNPHTHGLIIRGHVEDRFLCTPVVGIARMLIVLLGIMLATWSISLNTTSSTLRFTHSHFTRN